MNKKGKVLWLTGLPASGKSTISKSLLANFQEQKINAYILDGDVVRTGLCSDLGFSHEDRTENIRRIGEVAKILCDASVVCIVAFISPYRADRDKVRLLVGKEFVEIFIDCPVEVCSKRDPKGMYQKAKKGEIKDFTGVSAPYEPPLKPEVHLKTSEMSVSQCVEKVWAYLKDR